jgi:hypothetical protein
VTLPLEGNQVVPPGEASLLKGASVSAPLVQTQRKARAGHQEVLKIREECERFAIVLTKVNRWLPESFAKKSSLKLLGGLAVGPC